MSVIVLNADLERLHEVSVPHAIRMLVRKVAVIEDGDLERLIGPYPWPRVLRLVRYVYVRWRYSRSNTFSAAAMFKRDKFTCAYCGRYGNTVDHVKPESRGGETSYLNCVTCCVKCNSKKANRTPKEAGMKLRFHPYVPDRLTPVTGSGVSVVCA